MQKITQNSDNNQYQELQCPNCGRTVRNTDKFCIFCGQRLNKQEISPKIKEIPEKERKELEKEVNKDLGFLQHVNLENKEETIAPFIVKETSQEELDDRVLSNEKNKIKATSDEQIEESIELPDDIKEQLKIKMQLAQVAEKKERLAKKLKKFMKELDEERYENDLDYAQKINLQLNALKTLKNELIDKENQLRNDLGGEFRMDQLAEKIEMKRQQLIELKRSFKHHQITKNVYEQLKQEYVEEYQAAKKELEDLRVNVIRWLSKKRAQKNRIQAHIRLLEGRFKVKEITKETFNEQKQEFLRQIENIEQEISILEQYSREKKRKPWE